MRLYRIKVIFSLSNINADFIQLILCMFVSHYIIENPFYGGALFLFTNIWTLFFQGNLRHIHFRKGGRLGVVMWLLLTLSIVAGLALVFIYPVVMQNLMTNYVSFFVLMKTARSVVTYWINKSYNVRKTWNRFYKVLFQILFILPCVAFALLQMSAMAAYITIGGFALTGFLLSFQSSTLASFGKYIRSRRIDKMEGIFSYQMFSNMTLYSQIAFSVGVIMYICYITFPVVDFSVRPYVFMAVWLTVMLISMELFSWMANRRGWVLSVNLFIGGVALWILGSVEMYRADDMVQSWFWTLFWGFGLACITAVTNRFNTDQKMVARLANKRVSDRDLYFRNLLTQIIAVIFSNTIMLCMVTVWAFIIPGFSDPEVPVLFRNIMVQVPVLFMLVSLFFALRQPLDERSRQKLINYSKGINNNTPTRENLNDRLIKENRVKMGVKIIVFFVKPFLRLKISGQENMDVKDFPAIFVCNHGIIYGPVAAIIYLPTYFRPWVDTKMVFRDLCAREMYARFIHRIPLLPAGVKRWISRSLAVPVTWAINSFDPIPVEKNSLRKVMTTFEDTVTVLSEGDNVLIFPEKPRRIKKHGDTIVRHETSTVGSLYTGFANIGNLYYQRTGKSLRFYPLYANRKGRTFRIGEPVVFDPGNDTRAEKQRISEELHAKMMALRGDLPEAADIAEV